MILNTIIIILAAILLIALLFFENRKNRKGMVPVKSSLSLLFIVTAVLQPHLISTYSNLLLVGLIFCLGGDIFLALPQKKMFLLGLISFLLGHIFFVLAFFFVAETSIFTWVGTLVALVISVCVYIWLKPHLGSMKDPVLFYVLVITTMVACACSVLGDSNLAFEGRILVFIGAISFYFSDIFVARDRFLKEEIINRLVGLPIYYVAQFLLAFSIGLLRQTP